MRVRESTPDLPSEPTSEDVPPTDAETSDAGVFCHMCGWENPPGARFCSSCGTKLQEAASRKIQKNKPATSTSSSGEAGSPSSAAVDTPVAPAPDVEPEQAAQPMQPMHMAMLVISGIMVVAVLYMITMFSRRAFPEVEPAPAQTQTAQQTQSGSQTDAGTADLAADVATRVAALEAEAEGLQGDALVAKKREIVAVLSDANRPDKAAPVQEEIAGLTGAGEDWFSAGHFYYDWMDVQSGEVRLTVAQRAARAYEEGLKQIPDDLNVRTALAMTYLNTRAPMQGVQQIRQVLETDPDHLQGNFYYGVMLMQINRLDQARTQFQRVKELVGPESTLYQQADMMLQNLNG